MKRTVCAIIMFLSLTLWSAPASALIVDVSTLAAKLSEMVGKIADMTTKITQQVSQVKQMASQGFNKDALFELATTYATSYGKALIKQKQEAFIKSTREKNLKNLENERNMYKENSLAYYDQKIKISEQNMSEAEEKNQEAWNRKNELGAEVQVLEDEYKKAKASDNLSLEEEAFEKLRVAKMELETAEAEADDLLDLIRQQKEEQNRLKVQQEKIGTDEDKKYQEYTGRIKALQKKDASEKENSDFVYKEGTEEEWDSNGVIEKFSPSEEDYDNFMERYFYDPKKMKSATGPEGRTEYQTNMDRVARERRFLVTNTAAHLLQVTATLRREIPVRTIVMDEMFQNTPKASGELEAISSYSATRIENMKALLMYAKLQSARLQYMAAKELLKLDGVKLNTKGVDRDYSKFDLQYYLLDETELNNLYKEQNSEAKEDNYKNEETFDAIQ